MQSVCEKTGFNFVPPGLFIPCIVNYKMLILSEAWTIQVDYYLLFYFLKHNITVKQRTLDLG